MGLALAILVSGVADDDFKITSQCQPEVLTPVILDDFDPRVILHLCSKLILVPFSRVQVQPRAFLFFPPTPAMMLLCWTCIYMRLPPALLSGLPMPCRKVVPPGPWLPKASGSPPRAGAPPTAGDVDVSAAMVVAMQRKLQARTMVAAHMQTIFATMLFLHLAKAGISISSQLCLFFISRKQVFHLRKHAFSSSRESNFSIFANMSFLHFAKLFVRARQVGFLTLEVPRKKALKRQKGES